MHSRVNQTAAVSNELPNAWTQQTARSNDLLQAVVRHLLCFGGDERRRMLRADESVYRQIFIHLRPVNSITGGRYLEIFPLLLQFAWDDANELTTRS